LLEALLGDGELLGEVLDGVVHSAPTLQEAERRNWPESAAHVQAASLVAEM